MALRELLCSSPGTGKTIYCIEQFRNEILKSKGGIDSRSFFILPSREHAERIQNQVLGRTVPGLFNAHILTINDFAVKLAGLLSWNRPTDAVRKRILEEILRGGAECSNSQKSFSYFKDVLDCEGFYDLLADQVKEFKAGLLTVREFEKRAQGLLKKDPVFRSKFKDLTTLFKSYNARLAELGFKEAEDDIAELAGNKNFSSKAELVIFDGFYYFTRAQRMLIEWAAAHSARTLVTLTLPGNKSERPALFEYPEKTRLFLKEAGFAEKRSLFTENHRTREPSLLYLEKNLFLEDTGGRPPKPSAITIFQASGVRTEVEMIAREIKKIVREEDVYFSDICVILRGVKDYESVIDSVLAEFEIPAYVHERKKLIEHGFTLTLYRFLNLAVENWKREDLNYVMKSGYLAGKADYSEVLEVENLALRENLAAGRDRWEKLPGRNELSRPARDFLKFILESEKKILAAKNPSVFRREIFLFLNHFKICRDAEAASPEEKTEAQVFLSVRALIEDAARRDPSAEKDFHAVLFIKEIQESLKSGLFSLKPRGRNRVQVYDAVMAMPKEYKVVFVAGLLEGAFPLNTTEDPLLKDRERKEINKNGVVLEERLSRISGERYFFYMALTRAKEKLYLTYPLYNSEGRPSLPSFFLEEVEKCFDLPLPILKKDLDDFFPSPAEWETAHEVTRGLSQLLFDPSYWHGGKEKALVAGVPALIREWLKKDGFREVLTFGFSGEEAVLRDERIQKMFAGLKGPFSATRLETYATCPFKYFAGKTLYLNEPLEDREAIEIGKVLHGVLEEFYKSLSEEEKLSGSFLADQAKMKKTLGVKLQERMEKSVLKNAPLYRRKTVFNFMSDTLDLFTAYEKEDFERRRLVPLHFEFDFGRAKDSLAGCLTIQDPAGDILIEGQIDRIDKTAKSGKAVVIDYKTSERAMKVKERLRKGLELQLPIYLLAVRQLLGLETMAAELRILKNASSEGLYRESDREALGLGARKKAYGDEEFEKILSETKEHIRQYVRRLRGGDISVNSKTCDYCSFSSVCRFEPWKLVYENPS